MGKLRNGWEVYRSDGLGELAVDSGQILPTWLGLPYEMGVHLLFPGRDFVSFRPGGETWIVTNHDTGDVFHFPRCPHVLQYKKVAIGYGRAMEEKYTETGFVEVEPEDVVIDIGAFVGAFTRAASSTATSVIAIEPSPATLHCLKLNTAKKNNVTALNTAIWNESEPVELQLGMDPTDHSLLDVDDEATGWTVKIDGKRLDDLATELEIPEVDFLKLDAEGGEPEVLEGIGDLNIKKLAVDCGNERYGESPADEVKSILKERGYSVKQRGEMVFAKS